MSEVVFFDGVFKGKLISKNKNGVIKTDMDIFSCPSSLLEIIEVEDYEEFLAFHKASEKDKSIKRLEKELEKTDNKLFKIVEDLVDYCKTTGYIPDNNTKNILKDRKDIRQAINNL